MVRQALAVHDVRPRVDSGSGRATEGDVVDQRQRGPFIVRRDLESSKRNSQRIPHLLRLSMTWHSLIEVAHDDDRCSISETTEHIAENLTELQMLVPATAITTPSADMRGRPRDADPDNRVVGPAHSRCRSNESATSRAGCPDVDESPRRPGPSQHLPAIWLGWVAPVVSSVDHV